MLPAISLIFTAAAALVNLWLALRCGRVRSAAGISHGDGGNVLLARRMRAQLNFAENTPIILILFLLVEMCGTRPLWLSIIAPAYIIGRICHGIGMDKDGDSKARMAGMVLTMLTLAVLVVMALICGYSALSLPPVPSSAGAQV